LASNLHNRVNKKKT